MRVRREQRLRGKPIARLSACSEALSGKVRRMPGSSLSWWYSGAVIWIGFAIFSAIEAKWLLALGLLLLGVAFLFGGLRIRNRVRRGDG